MHVDLRALIDESAIDAGVRSHPSIEFENQVPDDVVINVDPDQISRVFVNIMKNAREALESQSKTDDAKRVFVKRLKGANCNQILIGDNGGAWLATARQRKPVCCIRWIGGAGGAGGTGGPWGG